MARTLATTVNYLPRAAGQHFGQQVDCPFGKTAGPLGEVWSLPLWCRTADLSIWCRPHSHQLVDSSHYLVYNNSNRNSNSNYNYTIPPSYLLRRDPPLLPILVLCYVTLLLKSFGGDCRSSVRRLTK